MSIAAPVVATAERPDDAPMGHGNASVLDLYLRAITAVLVGNSPAAAFAAGF